MRFNVPRRSISAADRPIVGCEYDAGDHQRSNRGTDTCPDGYSATASREIVTEAATRNGKRQHKKKMKYRGARRALCAKAAKERY